MKTAASYVRVSTEEQAKWGYSIEAQREAIRKYAAENGYVIVKEYADEGVSGTKPYTKRPALSQFMTDIQSGMKVDVLLFTKLDRFYRSVKLYYQAMEILDSYKVAWKAILENYETETVNGRFTINLFLAIAEQEAGRTSERIKFVFADKIRRGEVVTGKVPMGYKTVDHHLVIDEPRAEIVRLLFDCYDSGKSAYGAIRELHKRYGMDMSVQTALNILKTRTYTGFFRGNPEYCPQIIPEDQFRRVQAAMKARGVRQNQSGQTYIFSGLLICSECGRKLAGCRQISPHNGETYLYYRCPTPYKHADLCHRKKRVREDVLESWLLENLDDELCGQQYRVEAELQDRARNQGTGKPDRAAILRKLDRLKDLYVNEIVDMEQYKKDYTALTAQLAEAEAAERDGTAGRTTTPDFQRLRDQVAGIRTLYTAWGAEERQIFWRGIVRKIVVDTDNTAHIFFG